MNIQLTISLLVSDRMETLRKCLDSLKPLLRELDSELIAVFTGKMKKLSNFCSNILRISFHLLGVMTSQRLGMLV